MPSAVPDLPPRLLHLLMVKRVALTLEAVDCRPHMATPHVDCGRCAEAMDVAPTSIASLSRCTLARSQAISGAGSLPVSATEVERSTGINADDYAGLRGPIIAAMRPEQPRLR